MIIHHRTHDTRGVVFHMLSRDEDPYYAQLCNFVREIKAKREEWEQQNQLYEAENMEPFPADYQYLRDEPTTPTTAVTDTIPLPLSALLERCAVWENTRRRVVESEEDNKRKELCLVSLSEKPAIDDNSASITARSSSVTPLSPEMVLDPSRESWKRAQERMKRDVLQKQKELQSKSDRYHFLLKEKEQALLRGKEELQSLEQELASRKSRADAETHWEEIQETIRLLEAVLRITLPPKGSKSVSYTPVDPYLWSEMGLLLHSMHRAVEQQERSPYQESEDVSNVLSHLKNGFQLYFNEY